MASSILERYEQLRADSSVAECGPDEADCRRTPFAAEQDTEVQVPPPTLLVSERRLIPSGAFVHRSLALDDMAKVLRVGPVTAPIPLASG